MSEIKKRMMNFATIDDVYTAFEQGYKIDDTVTFIHPKKTGGKSKRLSLGRVWFNLLLPDDYKLIDESINKKKLDTIIKNISEKYELEEVCDIITDIQREAFEMSVSIPATFSIDALILPDNIKEEKEKLQKEGNSIDPVEYSKKVSKISEKFSKEMEHEDHRINDTLVAGIKGDPKVWGSLMISQGYVTDIEGNEVGPINKSISDGYSPKEFYQAASEARRGFFYKAAISAEPGYLSRRVTMATAGVIVDANKKDCGTTKTFKLKVDEKIGKLLIGRIHLNNRKKSIIKSADEIIGKTISLRSPLYCKSENGICSTCYGESFKGLDTKNIGILAGGAINNAALNAYMKMRHGSSAPEMIDVDFLWHLDRFGMNNKEFKKYFTAEKNKIIANEECYVELSTENYKEDILIESRDHYTLPGILTIKLDIEPTFPQFTLPINHQVRLIKPSDIEDNGKKKILKFVPGETIIEKYFYKQEVNVSLIMKLLDGQTKYVTNPEMLVMGLHEQMPGVDFAHYEVIVQNMFRDAEEPTIPSRLSGYKNFVIMGQKALPFVSS